MINPWYDRVAGNAPMIQPQQSGMIFQNPIQKAQYIMQALTNPAAFVKQHFPDVPDQIANDPNQILQYLQQTRGISNQQLQQIMNQYPRR